MFISFIYLYILKVPQNENIPEEVLIDVAKLAAEHSKAKNSSHTPMALAMTFLYPLLCLQENLVTYFELIFSFKIYFRKLFL